MRGNIPELSIDGQINLPDVPVGLRLGRSSDFIPLQIAANVNKSSSFGVSNIYSPQGDKNYGFFNTTPGNDVVNIGALASIAPGAQLPADSSNGLISSPIFAKGVVDASFVSGFTWEMIRNLSTATIIAEKMARTKGSYKEFIQTFFDDVPSNQVNNVPRYIGGNVQPIVYTEVLQTSSDANTPRTLR